jgi:adenosylcobyric acid synthase
MSGRVLMIQGTSSSAGKSLLVAAMCRVFARRGLRVAPFKSQNMSNNAAVCADGSEIGRSQALQALAAGQPPVADMNPILLKPEADTRSQVILNGRPWRTLTARDYFRSKQELWPHVTAALDRLRSEYDLVVIEGAGSPAELNLRDVEIVNMAVARYAQAPVLLVGDIERGGVFAQLLGTLWLLPEDQRQLVRGLIVNKFRGDVTLFDDGCVELQQRGGVPVLGVLPWIPDLNLPEEDAEVLSRPASPTAAAAVLEIAVIRLPHISNFDDFAPLAADPRVRLRYVTRPDQLQQPHAVILPGTKSTLADLAWLRRSGLAEALAERMEAGTHVVGICGGYQMLGRGLHDPDLIEALVPEMPGLGLLPIETTFAAPKQTYQVQATIRDDACCPGAAGHTIRGYEIHLGHTTGGQGWLELQRCQDTSGPIRNSAQKVDTQNRGLTRAVTQLDGAAARDGRIWGCYVHGLFDSEHFRNRWLEFVARSHALSLPAASEASHYHQQLQRDLDRLADSVEAALDMAQLERLLALPACTPATSLPSTQESSHA